LSDINGTDFNRLQFGGTTGSFPSLKRSGTTLISRLADDSANAPLEASNVTATGTLSSTLTAVTLAAAATTFAVISSVVRVTGDIGGNTISTITGGTSGTILVLFFVDSLVTITDTGPATANTVNLSAAFTSAAGTTLTLFSDGNKWYEVSRSVN